MYSCEYCKKLFQAERVTARFCSTKCRVKFNREQNRKDAKKSVADMSTYLARLVTESQSISDQLDVVLQNARLNRDVKNAWFAIDDLRQRNREILREITDLVAN